ncbi:choline-phosphate cytidylyltransferase B isoform X2 [Lepeophtheirus salmonis]|uniref:choline-phosphate cytidylyltransferase n=2 Tax=Lepeophtheirus salmonis TaxID=72036 RepID=D3PGM9_LEPSM|nr:choline-phosphate cytidylyltransferase B-like isoform X2 [Lepeophtheirus salmonis]ADD24425.1 Choline-phosphate cytidylyltransferase B [Lepeophtheirus salmonis]
MSRKREAEGSSSPASEQRLCTHLGPAPFDSDKAAAIERESQDYSIKITLDMARSGLSPRKVRVYADGIYDLFHQGHARQLMQAKNVFGPRTEVYLLVGCTSDELTNKRKGKTVMSEEERYEAIRHCRYVDEVVRDAPWECDDDFLSFHKIDFVAHDEAPYVTESGGDVYAALKEKGMFVATQRTDGVSTSDVVARIVKDYDKYIRRNLARGYTRQDLNVSFFHGNRLKLGIKVDEVKEKTKGFIERKKEEYASKIEVTSKELIGTFMALFGARDWNFDQFWAHSKERLSHALSPPASPSRNEDDDYDEDQPQPKRVKIDLS